jgi:hypothetical protein
MKNDESFDFYIKMDRNTVYKRYEDFRHFYRVRIPLEEGEEMNLLEGL